MAEATDIQPFGARSELANQVFATPPKPVETPNALRGALAPATFEDALKMAYHLSKSPLVPKGYQGKDKAGDIVIAGMWGASLGLDWLHSLKAIAVINGSAGLWGDVGYALMLRSGLLVEFDQSWDAEKKVATCTIGRKGGLRRTATFSWEQAKTAGLAGKNTYQAYPDVMCGWRAFWRAAKPVFSDIFMGLDGAEELEDHSPVIKPIQEPKALPAPPLSAADALGQAFAGEGQAALPPPPRPPAAPPAEAKTETVYVTEVAAREDKDGPLWWLKLQDSRKGYTRVQALAKLADEAIGAALPVSITHTPGKKEGVLVIQALTWAPIPDQDAKGEPDGADPADDGGDPPEA